MEFNQGTLRQISSSQSAMKRWILVAVLLVACGGDPFDSVGSFSSDWIDSGLTTTIVTTTTSPTAGLIAVEATGWSNDTLTVDADTPKGVIAAVWKRSDKSSSFVQASKREVSIAVPGIRFPELIPTGTRAITSQLVYDRSDASLASDVVAAFGLWNVEPYTKSRAAGQLGVLEVATDEPSEDFDCEDLLVGGALDCIPVTIDGGTGWYLGNEVGNTLIWFADGLRYELFLREPYQSGQAVQMAESAQPLQGLG